jgi:hypothetical protein
MDILQHWDGRVIQSDRGAEFGPSLAATLAKMDIRLVHSSAYNPRANGVVERWNGYLKRTLHRLMDANGTRNWVDLLPGVVENYNSTTQRVTGATPNDLKDGKAQPAERLYAGAPSDSEDFTKGDVVRLAATVENEERRKGTFRKGYEVNWSEDLYEVVSKSRPKAVDALPQYTVRELESGTQFPRRVWPYEMQKVDPDALIDDESKRVTVPREVAAQPEPPPRIERPKRERHAPSFEMRSATRHLKESEREDVVKAKRKAARRG